MITFSTFNTNSCASYDLESDIFKPFEGIWLCNKGRKKKVNESNNS